MLYAGTGPDANRLLGYSLPQRAAPEKKLYEAVAAALTMKSINPQAIGNADPRVFINNGLTTGETSRTPAALVTCTQMPDPQMNTGIPDVMDDCYSAQSTLNDYITQTNYVHLRHTQVLFANVLAECSTAELRAIKFCELYNAAIRSFDNGGGAGFPQALGDMINESNQMDDYLTREADTVEVKYVLRQWTFNGTYAPVGGFDTLGSVLAQLYMLGYRAMGLMSTQIPCWMVRGEGDEGAQHALGVEPLTRIPPPGAYVDFAGRVHQEYK